MQPLSQSVLIVDLNSSKTGATVYIVNSMVNLIIFNYYLPKLSLPVINHQIHAQNVYPTSNFMGNHRPVAYAQSMLHLRLTNVIGRRKSRKYFFLLDLSSAQ